MKKICLHNEYFILYALVSALSTYWLFLAFNTSINTDVVYLTQSAIYLLSGEKMSQAFYDNNPPLCMIIYIIPAFFIHVLNTPFYETGLIYTLILILITSIVIFSLLKPFPNISTNERILTALIFFITNTITANLYISEKDQYIIMGLFPFVLLQLSLGNNYKISNFLKTYTLITGGIFIIAKPHFIAIPALLILYRALKTKKIRAIFMEDALALIASIAIYGILLISYFNDYTTIILPDALTLYTTVKNEKIIYLSFVFIFILGALLFCCYFLPKNPSILSCLFLFFSILCIIPYGIQGKGFYYHLLPALSFFTCGSALAFYHAITQYEITTGNPSKISTIVLICLTLYGASYALFYVKPAALTHNEYKNTSLATLLNQCKNENCSYFMFNDSTEITQQLSVYTHQPHASRFASLWFLPPLLSENNTLSQTKKNELKKKYANMVAEDFQKFKPDMLILGKFFITKNSDIPFDFISFFSAYSENFRENIKNYTFRETVKINIKDYFPGTLINENNINFDIYERNQNIQQE